MLRIFASIIGLSFSTSVFAQTVNENVDPQGYLTELSSGQTECYGPVNYATLDSAIGDCSFISHGKIANQISKICKMGDVCMAIVKIHGTVEKGYITKVFSVTLIKKDPSYQH